MNPSDRLIDRYVSKRPVSQTLYQEAGDVLAGRMGHDLRNFKPFPLYIREGHGSRKWDVDGNMYVDFHMGNAALLLGHAAPEVISAIGTALPFGTHFGNEHPAQLKWAALLQQMVPCADKVRFVNSGTEATLLAYRIAQAHTGRSKLLQFEGHFHGWHDHVLRGATPPFGSIPSAGVPNRTLQETVIVPSNELGILEEVLAADDDIAAAILEPSGASWGRVPITEEFLSGVRSLTKKHGVPLIFDEVITGFRWGTGGAQTRHGVIPDLACLAKTAAGGMPGGALVGRSDIMRHLEFSEVPKVIHYGTFNASPLTAAAAIATIETIASTDAISRADALAEDLRNRLNIVLDQHSVAGFVYGPSSTFHVYFETDPERVAQARNRDAINTRDTVRLKGMPGPVVLRYQQLIRSEGVDFMSSTGGVTSSVHTDADLEWMEQAFNVAITHLLDEGLITTVG